MRTIKNIVVVGCFLLVILATHTASATYIPSAEEKNFAEHLSEQSFAKAVAWSQKGSLWVSVIRDAGTNSDLYEQLAYGICADAKKFKIIDFYIHIWDARAMMAGNMKRLTDRIHCE